MCEPLPPSVAHRVNGREYVREDRFYRWRENTAWPGRGRRGMLHPMCRDCRPGEKRGAHFPDERGKKKRPCAAHARAVGFL